LGHCVSTFIRQWIGNEISFSLTYKNCWISGWTVSPLGGVEKPVKILRHYDVKKALLAPWSMKTNAATVCMICHSQSNI